ncbi:MAG: hypothetical protein KAH01_02385 [Caldisericia bacterium]|nr:hypothetical protein [Caldisericia bacterium]
MKLFWMSLLLLPIFTSGCVSLNFDPEELNAWESSIKYDASGTAVERFIPVHLFVGAKWDGTRELNLPPINKKQTPNGAPLRIVGPVPCCGIDEPIAYKRSRDSRLHGGFVTQYFLINKNKNALELRSQSINGKMSSGGRYGKFPLGWWKEGEERVIYSNNLSTLTIKELDFSYRGVPHSLKFRFHLFGKKGKGKNCTYVFSPGWGVTSVSCD